MATLIVTRGLPGSGKTTRAVAWVAEDPARRARVNRDQIRIMLHGGRLGTEAQEEMVTAVQQAGVRALLQRGVDVVADDTNIRHGFLSRWHALAHQLGVPLLLWDLITVPVEECIRRDALRAGAARVGEQVIRDMEAQYRADQATTDTETNPGGEQR